MTNDRLALGFNNPNHAAAMVCAVLPLCWGWRRHPWLGRCLSLALLTVLLLTQSRTGMLAVAAEAAAWGWLSRQATARSAARASSLRKPSAASTERRRRCGLWLAFLALTGVSLWWMWPRLVIDGSILNRPKIWLAGLQLFAANPNGVGLGNSGTIASAFLLDGIPEIRTMISAHVTLLAELGWIVGWAWLAFIGVALLGLKSSPRMGVAFTGLTFSGCSSTIFDWPLLFDFAEQGGLGLLNWALSWMMFLMFAVLGGRLIAGAARRVRSVRPAMAAVAMAGVTVLGLRLTPAGDAPQVREGMKLWMVRL